MIEIPAIENYIQGPYFRKGKRAGRQGGGTRRQEWQQRRSGEPQHDNRRHAGRHAHQTREQAAEAEAAEYQEP